MQPMPQLAQAIAASHGGVPFQAGPQGPPPTIQVNPSAHPDNQRLEQQLGQTLAGLRAAMMSPQSDPVIGLDLRKAEMAVAKVIADLHKERQAALGGGPATAFLRRNSG